LAALSPASTCHTSLIIILSSFLYPGIIPFFLKALTKPNTKALPYRLFNFYLFCCRVEKFILIAVFTQSPLPAFHVIRIAREAFYLLSDLSDSLIGLLGPPPTKFFLPLFNIYTALAHSYTHRTYRYYLQAKNTFCT